MVQFAIIRSNQNAIYFYLAGSEISGEEENRQDPAIKEDPIPTVQPWHENRHRRAQNTLAMWRQIQARSLRLERVAVVQASDGETEYRSHQTYILLCRVRIKLYRC